MREPLTREGNPERRHGQVPGFTGHLRLLNEHHSYLEIPTESPPPEVGERIAVVPDHVCPVSSFEELILSNQEDDLGRWNVDAQGKLN